MIITFSSSSEDPESFFASSSSFLSAFCTKRKCFLINSTAEGEKHMNRWVVSPYWELRKKTCEYLEIKRASPLSSLNYPPIGTIVLIGCHGFFLANGHWLPRVYTIKFSIKYLLCVGLITFEGKHHFYTQRGWVLQRMWLAPIGDWLF